VKFPEGSRVRLVDLDIDLQRRSVWRAHTRLAIKGKTFDLLEYLIQRYPEAAGHDELMASVWVGRVVTPDTLTQRVKLLRQALGETGKEGRYVASVHGRGYRLAAAPAMVAVGDAGGEAAFTLPRWTKAALILILFGLLLVLATQGGLVHSVKHFIKHGL